jgi:hypothetical protein
MDRWLVAPAFGWHMKWLRSASRLQQGRRQYWIVSLCAGALVLCSATVVAEPVRKHHEAASESQETYTTWSEFLKAGPSVWGTHEHPIWDFTVREAVWKAIKTDPGGTSPMIEFLLWKQSLDPARFDLYHPKIGPAIDKLVKTSPTQVSSPPATTTPTSSTSPSEGQTLSPPGTETPEPSTWLVVIGMAGWALWRRRRVVD